MKTFNQVIASLVLSIGLVLSSGCAKNTTTGPVNPINAGATVTVDLAKGVRLVEDGIRSANQSGAASTEVTASVLRLTARINKAGLDADQVLRSQVSNPNASAKTILAPLVGAIQNAISQDVIKITDANVRNTVSSSLSALQLTITSILTALGGN